MGKCGFMYLYIEFVWARVAWRWPTDRHIHAANMTHFGRFRISIIVSWLIYFGYNILKACGSPNPRT